MKLVIWLIAIVIAVPIAMTLLMYGASELGGEVVTLERAESSGGASKVRIWIVDEQGVSWIEHGDPDSFWISQLATSSNIVLAREGRTTHYTGAPDPDAHDDYHRLRRAKYGVADQIVALMAGDADECQGVPVRLQLVDQPI